MSVSAEEDEWTELVDFNPERVDLVGKASNGTRFLIAKQDEDSRGLVPADMVRDLIAKAEPERTGRERAVMPSGITVSGSPADIAAFIHQASVRKAAEPAADEIAKAKYSADQLKAMGAKGHAFKNPDGSYSYPIGDDEDLGNAIRAVGRGGADHDAIRRYVIRRAKELGSTGKIPENWASDGSLKEKVTKDMSDMGPELDDGIDGLDPTVPLAAPEGDAPGDPTDPGSPAWEAIDAATACKWTSILARARVAVDLLAQREMLEAASGDSDDADKAWDLQDVCCAIDYAISVLAPFAVSEQSASDVGADAMGISKAMTGFDAAPLAAIEGFAAIRKAGRVLSAANEAHIRDAAAALNTVLSSLPKAPVTDDGQSVAKQKGTTVAETQTAPEASAAPVAKETASAEAQAADTSPVDAGGVTGMGIPKGGPSEQLPGDVPGREVLKSALTLVFGRDRTLVGVTDTSAIVTHVAKADGDGEKKAMQAVFDQDGDLIGIVDPDAIQPVTGAGAKPAADDTDTEGADDSDLTPQPPAEAGTPADTVADDGTVAKQDADGTRNVLKSIVQEAVAELLGKQVPAEDVAKQADVAGLLQEVETLKARLVTVEEQPAIPKVLVNGQAPPAHQMRGQDHGAPPQIDVAKARAMKQRMYTADPAEANRIATELNQSAIATLEAIHAGARQ